MAPRKEVALSEAKLARMVVHLILAPGKSLSIGRPSDLNVLSTCLLSKLWQSCEINVYISSL